VLEHATPPEREFFDALDAELEKITNFYYGAHLFLYLFIYFITILTANHLPLRKKTRSRFKISSTQETSNAD
jgi:hypothetical protein